MSSIDAINAARANQGLHPLRWNNRLAKYEAAEPTAQNPVGACGDTAPTGDRNTIAYTRGVLQVEADTYRRQRDRARASLEVLAAAVTGGHQWEIQAALHRARLTLNQNKDRP